MKILLPPVSQVTNTRINLTQHHRNRSLDSALQRIPEVEVSSPNAESENTFCTPSILGTNMCSKIATTAANVVTAALTTTTTPALTAASGQTAAAQLDTDAAVGIVDSEYCAPMPVAPPSVHELSATAIKKCSLSSTAAATSSSSSYIGGGVPTLAESSLHLGNINPSVIVETCPTLRVPRPKSSESAAVRGGNIVGVACIKSNSSSSSSSGSGSNGNNCKKREDLTSLGSDDSGILCGSDSDQISLHRIRHSHESLDSGEMDNEDMLDTNSMDEEYGILQSDLCFYQTNETDCQTLRPSRNKKHSIPKTAEEQDEGGAGDASQHQAQQQHVASNERMRYREMNMSQAALNAEKSLEAADVVDSVAASAGKALGKPAEQAGGAVIETTKNEVLFKNFFSIFRSAQSIIENHEKKNAAKNKEDAAVGAGTANAAQAASSPEQIKSPTDISKKKEFFSNLITSSASKKAAAAKANAASASSTPAATPTAAELTTSPLGELKTPLEQLSLAAINSEAAVGEKTLNLHLPCAVSSASPVSKPTSIATLQSKLKVPGVVKCFIKKAPANSSQETQAKTEKGPSGLLRFFKSPVFNIHFAVHYLFYSKEPGVLSYIGNKIFSFPDLEVDLYIPQLIVMYIQMDELAEVLDPYLTIRCRKSVDFSLKCLWLLEAYNYQVDSMSSNGRKPHLALMKEIFSKKERKILQGKNTAEQLKDANELSAVTALAKKTHHRSQSDATVLLSDCSLGGNALSISNRLYQQPPYTTQTLQSTPSKLCLGDLTSGRAFENGCTCFETVRGQVNGLLGQKTVCSCGAPKTAPQKEFMRALINVGKNLTVLPSKAEKTSALRMFLNLINKNLPARVWLPLYSDIPHHVVRITEEKTAVLNSKDKTPYIIYVEVVEVSDIYSSPLIPKMMPSLRHTKSEEHLECSAAACSQLHSSVSAHANCSRTSSCSSHGSSCRRKKEAKVSESSCSLASEHVGCNVNALGAQQREHDAAGAATSSCNLNGPLSLGGLHLTEDDVWSQEDDDITAQYMNLRKMSERDAISQMSLDSCDSRDQGLPVLFNIGDVRTRHCNNLNCENTKSFSNDPEDPSAAALKEPWHEKVKQIRDSSPYGHLSSWRLMSAIVKCGDDLRQELMATQLLQMFKIIWQEEHADLWVRPYKIVCLSNDSGLIEPILNTVSLHQIKKNSNKSLRDYFIDEYGAPDGERFCNAQKNFVQSCAAYCLISYLLQVKDRHNGNILLHSDGHIIHIDFGFILSISPKNLGFEQSPFKLTPEFVEVMDGTSSEHWKEFNHLLLVGMMTARKHMDRIINFVEIMRSNAQLPCFKNGCSGTVQNLRKRFHMNLTEQEMERKVEQLVQDSLKSLSTKLYDGYQYYTNGIL